MKTNQNKRMLLELYADGELDAKGVEGVERLLANDEQARAYLETLREQRELVRIPLDLASEDAAFDGLFARVMGAVDAAPRPQRDAQLERLAVAQFDGESLSARDAERVAAYVEARAEARAGVDALRSMRELVRAPIAEATAKVDFGALSRRIDAAIDAELARRPQAAARETAVQVSIFGRFWAAIGAWRTVAICASTAAIVLAVVRLDGDGAAGTDSNVVADADGDGQTVVHNHYYVTAPQAMPQVRAVRYEQGFVGGFVPGDLEQGTAPVVWIVPDPLDVAEGSGAQVAPVLQGKPL